MNRQPSLDLGIIAIVGDEVRAIRDYLKPNDGFRDFGDYRAVHSVRDYCLGQLRSKDDKWFSVGCVQTRVQGNESAAAAYQAIQEELSPTVIVVLGIGGAIDNKGAKEAAEKNTTKLELGDVVLADAILDYDTRSEEESGTQHSFNPLPPIEPWLRQIWQRLERRYGEDPKLEIKLPGVERAFKCKIGQIGSGAAVIKDELSEEREYLNAISRKARAVDTEAKGGATQHEESKLRHVQPTKGFMVIRGISDGANAQKDNRCRYDAAFNAMHALALLLAECDAGFSDVLPNALR